MIRFSSATLVAQLFMGRFSHICDLRANNGRIAIGENRGDLQALWDQADEASHEIFSRQSAINLNALPISQVKEAHELGFIRKASVAAMKFLPYAE